MNKYIGHYRPKRAWPFLLLTIFFLSVGCWSIFRSLTQPHFTMSTAPPLSEQRMLGPTTLVKEVQPKGRVITIVDRKSKNVPEDCQAFLRDAKMSRNVLHVLDRHSINTRSTTPSPRHAIPPQIVYLHYNPRIGTPRYLCSVESAARQNPSHRIVIHAANVTDFNESLTEWRRRFGKASARVAVVKMDYEKYFAGTPLWRWWASGTYKKSSWVGQNLGNAYRLAVVWHEGGAYMDLDIVHLNPIAGAGRMLAKEKGNKINNAAFQFPSHDRLVWDLMEGFAKGFNGWKWANNGPTAITRVFRTVCADSAHRFLGPPTLNESTSSGSAIRSKTHVFRDAPQCNGLALLPANIFYPIGFRDKDILLSRWDKKCKILKTLQRGSVGLHWWHKLVPDETKLDKDAVLSVVMGAYCPVVFDVFE